MLHYPMHSRREPLRSEGISLTSLPIKNHKIQKNNKRFCALVYIYINIYILLKEKYEKVLVLLWFALTGSTAKSLESCKGRPYGSGTLFG
jgi:hypothetical protein